MRSCSGRARIEASDHHRAAHVGNHLRDVCIELWQVKKVVEFQHNQEI